ncbi:MAG: hypothetical protein HYW24_00910 [Candidatus Aenigmarchaeota archaeon]|nr:hypothetical protein [Candidatus Aenigmarchaeota archaeon]
MGFLKILGKIFGSTVFTTFLVLAIMMGELVSFTDYQNIKESLLVIVKQSVIGAVGEAQLDQFYNFLVFQCTQKNSIPLPIPGYDITVDCNDVRTLEKDQLFDKVSVSIVDSVYYKKFSCDFVSCLQSGDTENMLIALSSEGNQFYKNMQMYLWIATVVGLAIMLASIDTWTGRLKGTGWVVVVTALPFLFLNYISEFIMPPLPEGAEAISTILNQLLDSIRGKFLIVFAAGVVLLLAGYGLDFYLRRQKRKK